MVRRSMQVGRALMPVMLTLALAGLSLPGCASLLGIEEASCDPAVDEDCKGGDDAGAEPEGQPTGNTGEPDADVGRAEPDGGRRQPGAQGGDPGEPDVDAVEPDGSDGGMRDGADSDGVDSDEPEPAASDASAPRGGEADAAAADDSDSGTGDAGLPAADAAALEREVCAQYCSELDAACASVATQYATVEACETICVDALDIGQPDDSGVDTVYCRLNALRSGLAFGETDAVCESAGMAGIGECGPVCEIYCTLVEYRCPAQFDSAFNDNYDTCLGACSTVPIPGDLRFGSGVPSANTLQCRMYHIQNAFGNASTHCPHTVGDGVCE